MEIVEAVSFLNKVREGGSTQPWVVLVKGEDGETFPCVVKLFTNRQLAQQHAIAKEAFGCELAQMFDLPTPEWYLVNFTDAFVNSLPGQEKKELSGKAKGLKFGTKLLEGYALIKPDSFTLARLREYDIGSVYAFDNLAWNLDRGGFRNKPNILIREDSLALIDHE